MNIIIISVGLCVDFCAHIVHGFLTGKGDKAERVMYVMENIAPAVLNGGFSSLLALSLLVTSKSHVFVSFFKIFFMIWIFARVDPPTCGPLPGGAHRRGGKGRKEWGY